MKASVTFLKHNILDEIILIILTFIHEDRRIFEGHKIGDVGSLVLLDSLVFCRL